MDMCLLISQMPVGRAVLKTANLLSSRSQCPRPENLTTLCGFKLLNIAFPIPGHCIDWVSPPQPWGRAVGQSLGDGEEAPVEDLPSSLLGLVEH